MSRFRFLLLAVALGASAGALQCGSDTFHTAIPADAAASAEGGTDGGSPKADAGAADACALACPQVVASNVVLAATLAVDDTYVWYVSREQTNAGGVWRVPKAGGTTEQVVSAPGAYSLALHRGIVSWTVAGTVPAGGGIYQRLLDGGPSPPVIPRASLRGIDADDEGIYWAENESVLGGALHADAGADAAADAGVLSSKPLGAQQVRRISALGDAVYFSSDAAFAIYRVKKRGGIAQVPESVIVALGSVASFAFGVNGELLWTVNGDASCAGGAVMLGHIQPDGRVVDGAPLAADEPCASNIALDDKWIYWTTSPAKVNSVRRMPKAGGAAQTLATPASKPTDLVVDDSGIYWLGLDPQSTGQRFTISRIAPKPL